MNPFENALKQLELAAEEMGLNPDTHEFLKHPMQELHVSIPVKMDDGHIKTFQGFRVLYSNTLGPGKGGVRFHPEETIDTIRALSFWMSVKTALLDLHLGGGKGGIICNPKEMSEGELERLTRGYIRAIYPLIGSDKDGLAPDVNTTAQTMSTMVSEFKILTHSNDIGVVTGKPISLGGSLGRNTATAMGGLFCLREALIKFDVGRKIQTNDLIEREFTVAIQGWGNAGSFAHMLIEEMFPYAKIIAVSDSKGGIHLERGLKYEDTKNVKESTGTVKSEHAFISNEDLLELDVDVLIPAALEGVITKENASNIKAKFIIELANGPTEVEADKILYENDVHIVPDFLANAGGVTVSAMEQWQNSMGYYWSEEEVNKKLDVKMTKAYHDVFNVSKEKNIDMRTAAYVLALGRIVEGIELQK